MTRGPLSFKATELCLVGLKERIRLAGLGNWFGDWDTHDDLCGSWMAGAEMVTCTSWHSTFPGNKNGYNDIWVGTYALPKEARFTYQVQNPCWT